MEIGNELVVNGNVKAEQATQAGEAVVLGADSKIPANLLSSSGGDWKWEKQSSGFTWKEGEEYMVVPNSPRVMPLHFIYPGFDTYMLAGIFSSGSAVSYYNFQTSDKTYHETGGSKTYSATIYKRAKVFTAQGGSVA